MKRVIGLVIVSVMLASGLSLSGCRTMHGLGQDISSGGSALARAAEPSKKKASQTSSSGKTSAASTPAASSSH